MSLSQLPSTGTKYLTQHKVNTSPHLLPASTGINQHLEGSWGIKLKLLSQNRQLILNLPDFIFHLTSLDKKTSQCKMGG